MIRVRMYPEGSAISEFPGEPLNVPITHSRVLSHSVFFPSDVCIYLPASYELWEDRSTEGSCCPSATWHQVGAELTEVLAE